MKHMKRLTIVALLLAVTLFVAGCTERTISIEWSPNPIMLTPGGDKITGTATIRVSSGLSAVTIKNVSAIGYDENGEVVDGMEFSKDINVAIPIIIGGSASQKITFDLSHDDAIATGVREVVVSVSGSISGKLVIEVEVEGEDDNGGDDT